jgi:hypothetical protein
VLPSTTCACRWCMHPSRHHRTFISPCSHSYTHRLVL